MNKTLSLSLLLDFIDKNKKMDHKQVVLDILLVTLYRIFKSGAVYLDTEDKTKVESLLKDLNNLKINDIFNIFLKANKIHKLQSVSDKIIEEVKMDYMKTQFEALSKQDKISLLKKYPAYKNFTSAVTT